MSDLIERLKASDIPDWLRGFYSVVYLTTFIHAIITGGAWMCCPPAYGDFSTFAHAVQIALGWTGATVSAAEVLIPMVLLVPKVYYGIKEKGRREGEIAGELRGLEKGKAEGMEEGKAEGMAEGERKGMAAGKAEGVDAMLAAMREAGVDEETRRRVEDIHAKHNGR